MSRRFGPNSIELWVVVRDGVLMLGMLGLLGWLFIYKWLKP